MTHPELTNGKDDDTPENSAEEKKEHDQVNGSTDIENLKNDVHKNNETSKVKLNGIHPVISDCTTSNSISEESDGKSKDATSDSDSYLTPNPILETHNYAKIPLTPSIDSNCDSLQKTSVTECR